MALTIVIGNRNDSSWSLRGWLALRMSGAAFNEILVPLGRPDSRERILQYSPTGKVPLLKSEDGDIWDSLAIAEYLAERFPEAHLWPRGEAARALARSVCAEMHSGFAALRGELPMDLRRQQPLVELSEATRQDIQRICEAWADCRRRFGQDGPFLFGHASLADAFYAPVAARFRSYAVELPDIARTYVETIYQWPAFRAWYDAALREQAGS
ncbi:glutathione S-transferase family protein [Pseudomonas aeruginosa]